MHSHRCLEDLKVPCLPERSDTLLFVQVGRGAMAVDKLVEPEGFPVNIRFVGLDQMQQGICGYFRIVHNESSCTPHNVPRYIRICTHKTYTVRLSSCVFIAPARDCTCHADESPAHYCKPKKRTPVSSSGWFCEPLRERTRDGTEPIRLRYDERLVSNVRLPSVKIPSRRVSAL